MKTTLLKIAAAAAGITLALCIAAACAFWYASRPKPPKPWNTTALTTIEAPAITSYSNENHIFLRYRVQNHTDKDYSIDKTQHLRVMGKYPNGSLTSPLEDNYVSPELPIFIPAQHTEMITLEIRDSVARGAKVSDDEYREQIRAHLNRISLDGFAVFDEENRYQIDLPKWLSVKPESEPASKP